MCVTLLRLLRICHYAQTLALCSPASSSTSSCAGNMTQNNVLHITCYAWFLCFFKGLNRVGNTRFYRMKYGISSVFVAIKVYISCLKNYTYLMPCAWPCLGCFGSVTTHRPWHCAVQRARAHHHLLATWNRTMYSISLVTHDFFAFSRGYNVLPIPRLIEWNTAYQAILWQSKCVY